jgi:hypothetical protein
MVLDIAVDIILGAERIKIFHDRMGFLYITFNRTGITNA